MFNCRNQLLGELTELPISTQGRSHQNLSGQVEIISQASTYSAFQIIVIVVHSMHSIYYRGIGTGPADPATAGPKLPVATSN